MRTMNNENQPIVRRFAGDGNTLRRGAGIGSPGNFRVFQAGNLSLARSLQGEGMSKADIDAYLAQAIPAFAGLKIDSLNGFLKATAGVIGTDIPVGSPPIELNFAYGDVSPARIAAVPLGGMITQVDIIILTPFNGVGAWLSVGDGGDHSGLMSVGQNDPKTIATYSTFPALTYVSMTDIFLYLAPGAGASAGRGVLLIYVI